MATRLVPKITIKSLVDYIEKISRYAATNRKLKCYRGQQSDKWGAIPSLFRPDMIELERNEKRAIRDLMSVHPNEFSDDRTMLDRLVRMQHFGLPTRLMDVSLNPLIALYFATEDSDEHNSTNGRVVALSIPEEREKYYDSDSVAAIANLANMTSGEKDAIRKLRGSTAIKIPSKVQRKRLNDNLTIQRLHQFIREEKPHFLPIIRPVDLFKPYYVHPRMTNRRILAQSGAFIIYGLTPTKAINFRNKIEETFFVIPHALKQGIQASLDLLGINESTVYPELDRAAKRIKNSYLKATP